MKKRAYGWAALGLLALVLGLRTDEAQARTLSYLVVAGTGEVLTLDTDTDTILARRSLQNLRELMWSSGRVVGSPADNLLFVIDGRQVACLLAYDFRTLAFKREVLVRHDDVPELLVPPRAPHFFALWTPPPPSVEDPAVVGQPGVEYAPELLLRIDKGTLQPLGNPVEVPVLGDEQGNRRFAYSADGTRLYVYSDARAITTFDAQSLQPVRTLDLTPRVTPGSWGWGVNDVQADKALVTENNQLNDTAPGRYTLFTVDLRDGSQSPRIATGREGDGFLTPQGDKAIFREATGVSGLERLQIYEVATGTKLGQIEFTAYGRSDLLAVRPAGDKAYVLSRGGPGTSGTWTLTSISLVTYSVVKQIAVPSSVIEKIIFFEQP